MSTEVRRCKVEQLDESELVRVAMRISMTSIAELHSKMMAESMNEADVMKEYIRLCPYVSPNSPVVQAAIDGVTASNCEGGSMKIPILQPTISTDSCPTTAEHSAPDSVINLENSDITGRVLKFKNVEDSDPMRGTKKNVVSQALTVLGHIFRTVLLDLPFALLFLSYLAAVWTHRVHDLYLYPQIKALVWDDERMFQEETYYKRECDAVDQSTFTGADLFLPLNATPEDAYEHQLIHGLTVFRSILTDKTATELRNFIRSKNFRLPEEESIFVIANKNRYSFGLGTEEPSVTNAMMELASHERLKPALEKILGPNPALIEMTAITATYGAKDQHWHDDVVARASALQFAHAFGPSYSVFVQLQNTTKEMGATACCPGTHFCATGTTEEFCAENGFQVVNEEGYWRAGDALLMNMNIYHRGAAHISEGDQDRVMLILTFVPQPRSFAESRQMAQGITFSLRWDMWGHTLDDLANANSRMAQPWATLRALGLYKQKDASWGVDYISGASMRIANEDNGFREDQLEDFMEHGLGLLPKFLYGEIDPEEEGWREFYLNTVVKCEEFLKSVNVVVLSAYLMLQSLVLLVGIGMGGRGGSLRRFGWVLVRLVTTHAIVYVLYLAAVRHVDNTQWARDIVGERRYTNPFQELENEYEGPTAWPHRNDVLIETRYQNEALAMYNDYVMAHPGNRAWKDLLESAAPLYVAYSGLPPVFRSQLAEYIVSSMESQSRRFLYQSSESHWFLMSRDDAVAFNNKEIKISSNPILRHLDTVFKYLISDLRSGHLRDFSMIRFDLLPHVIALKTKLLNLVDAKSNAGLARPESDDEFEQAAPKPSLVFRRSFAILKPNCNARFQRSPVNLSVGLEPEEPSPGAWILQGDIVEALEKRTPKNQLKWYYGEVDLISSRGYFSITFSNGKSRYVQQQAVRPYEPFFIDEKVEISVGGKFRKGKIVEVYDDDDHVDVELTKGGQKETYVFKSKIRRENSKRLKKERVTQYF